MQKPWMQQRCMNFMHNADGLCLLFHVWVFLQIPKKGKIYSVNEGNAKNWDGPTAKYAWKSYIIFRHNVKVSDLLSPLTQVRR